MKFSQEMEFFFLLMVLMSKIDGLQVRHLQLASCFHFMGHKDVGLRLDAYNC